ncbi:MAG: hypothetical protein [Bacteriophage sp.]|nr:MAG: hypothetical protein [Bacteriophage sp.]
MSSLTQSKTIRIPTARVFEPLLYPSRYKGAYGGRGSGKSHHFAEKVIQAALTSPKRIVCIREVQKSIKESVKRLLEDKIKALDVGSYFQVLDREIRGINGSLIIFQGMQDHTAESIKSLEGYDIAWVEEAQSLSTRSLRLLRPTIRKEGSELWFTWNPMSADDPIDAFLRGDNVPPDSKVVQANWSDNPWFPSELERERIFDLKYNSGTYDHVWEGAYLVNSDSQIFAGKYRIDDFEVLDTWDGPYQGGDLGFSQDPTAAIRCYIANDVLYVSHEAYKTKLELDDTATFLKGRIPDFDRYTTRWDNSRPESISYFKRHGLPRSEPVKKWTGSIEDGIQFLRSFREIVIHTRCNELAREFRLYSYKADPRTGDITTKIIDAYNHGIDALRYALVPMMKGKRQLSTPVFGRYGVIDE